MASCQTSDMVRYIDETINLKPVDDYCHNGLQLEGRCEVSRLICGVSLCSELIEEAISWKAEAILVHHGLFWKGEGMRLHGMRRERLKSLLQHDIAVIAYHLPLDFHPEFGNNALIARALGLDMERYLGRTGVLQASSPTPLTIEQFSARVAQVMGQSPEVARGGSRLVKSVGICSGGAQKYFDSAIDEGCDAYLTGEKSINCYHSAIETGVHFIAAGHHATERFGAKALGEHLAGKFGIEQRFVDMPNPF